MSSTETGAIFGNIVYESTGHSDRNVLVLNDIHIDIMDYISPATCPDVQFRSMWAEFEWEKHTLRFCSTLASLHFPSTVAVLPKITVQERKLCCCFKLRPSALPQLDRMLSPASFGRTSVWNRW